MIPDSFAVLDRAATTDVGTYNPRFIIDAVNDLQPMAVHDVWARIEAYLAARDKTKSADGLQWVCRALFDLPGGHAYPPVRNGMPAIPPPPDPARLPRFPVLIVWDVPFLAVDRYTLGGKGEPIELHVATYRAHGTLRERPLAPPPSTDGIEDAVLQEWKAAYGDAHASQLLTTISAQLVRMG